MSRFLPELLCQTNDRKCSPISDTVLPRQPLVMGAALRIVYRTINTAKVFINPDSGLTNCRVALSSLSLIFNTSLSSSLFLRSQGASVFGLAEDFTIIFLNERYSLLMTSSLGYLPRRDYAKYRFGVKNPFETLKMECHKGVLDPVF